jgi:hypothetical protein
MDLRKRVPVERRLCLDFAGLCGLVGQAFLVILLLATQLLILPLGLAIGQGLLAELRSLLLETLQETLVLLVFKRLGHVN